MTNYITGPTGYAVSLQGPYYETDASMRIYFVPADRSKLEATLDRYVNVGSSNTTYKPLGNRVVACFTNILEVRAGDTKLGYMHEIDVAFFIPALGYWGPSPIPTSVAFFAPYLFVNNPWAMATGREVHGFRKDMAVRYHPTLDVNSAAWTNKPGDLTQVVAWAIQAKGNNSKMVPIELATVIPPSAVPASVPWDIDDIIAEAIGDGPTIVEPGGQVPDDLGIGLRMVFAKAIEKIASAILAGLNLSVAIHVPLVFLRQFRDPFDSSLADVQQIIEADALAGIPNGVKLPGAYQLKFHNTASHPIADELGMPNDTPVNASLTLELSAFNFTLNHAS